MQKDYSPIKGGWFWCCGYRLQKITADTIIIGEIYCRHCKTTHQVTIVHGKLMREDITAVPV